MWMQTESKPMLGDVHVAHGSSITSAGSRASVGAEPGTGEALG